MYFSSLTSIYQRCLCSRKAQALKLAVVRYSEFLRLMSNISGRDFDCREVNGCITRLICHVPVCVGCQATDVLQRKSGLPSSIANIRNESNSSKTSSLSSSSALLKMKACRSATSTTPSMSFSVPSRCSVTLLGRRSISPYLLIIFCVCTHRQIEHAQTTHGQTNRSRPDNTRTNKWNTPTQHTTNVCIRR